MRLIRNLQHGLCNLWYWLPTIWRDRDWDSYFLYTIMQKSIRSLRKGIHKRNIHVWCEKKVQSMRICEALIDRLMKDEYIDIVFCRHDKKWGDLEVTHKQCEDNPELYQMLFHRDGAKTEEQKKQEHTEWLVLSGVMDSVQNRDRHWLFSIMEKYIDRWWD